MKTRKKIIGIISAAIVTAFIVISCEKDDPVNLSSADIEIAEDETFAEAIFNDLMNEIDAADATLLLKTTGDGCPIITVTDIDESTKEIVVDYGEGCEQIIYNHYQQAVDTLIRKGIIRIERTGSYKVQGSYRTATLEGYSVNGIKIEATRTIQNMGYDDNGHMWFSLTLENGKITTPDSVVITRNSSRERHYYAGEDTPTPWDDEYKIWGETNGTIPSGETYTRTIIDSLHVSMACRFILSGQVESVVGDREPVIIDYGDGDCDSDATLSRGGDSQSIQLQFKPKRRLQRVLRVRNNY